MTLSGLYQFFILVAFFVANIPWLGDRFLAVFKVNKNAWWRWLEWLVLYFVIGVLSTALEYKVTGGRHPQDWEFYATTFSLFIVFALPGFIYHYDLKRILWGVQDE